MKLPLVLHLDDLQQFKKSFPKFNSRLRNEVSKPDPDTSNERVRILENFVYCIPEIQLMMGKEVIWLHIIYNSLYLFGVKFNNHLWYSLSLDKPHFEGATNIGFRENYGALGCGVRELQTCGKFNALRNAFFDIMKFSISKELNKGSKKNKQNKQLKLEELKKSIARIIVTVCETLRFKCVYDAVYHQHEEITTTSVELIKNWDGEQTKYYNDRDAYDQTLTMAQPRDINTALVEKAPSLINDAFSEPSGTKMNKGTSSTTSSSKQSKKSSSSSRSSVKGKGAVVEAADADYHKLVSIIDDEIQVQYKINSMKPVHSAKAAINKLLMVTSEETASCSSIIESYTELPRD